MSRPTRQQLAPNRLEQVWEALATGFYPFQTMPGVSVTLSGDKGSLRGTWGTLAVLPDADTITVLE